MLRKLILASVIIFLITGGKAFGQGQNFGSGGGITSVSSLPATCTPGVTAPVQLSVVPFGIYYCSSTNAWSSTSTPVLTGSIFPADAKYGAKFNGRSFFSNVNTITLTNGGNTVTIVGGGFCNGSTVACPTGQISDVGKQVLATVNSCCGVTNDYLGVLAFANVSTTITAVSSSTTATISQNFTSACGGNCIFVVATNDDAALTAAEVDWAAANKCGSMNLPAGITLLLQPHFNSPGANCLGAEPELNYTAEVDGEGKGVTQLGIAAGFNFAGCPAAGCFFNYLESVVHDLAIVGFGWGNTGIGSATILISGALGAEWKDFSCVAVGGSDANLTGITTGVGFRAWGFTLDGCGKIGGVIGGINKFYYCFFGDTLGANIQINGDMTDYGCDYGTSGGTTMMSLNGASARYHGIGSNLFACSQVANATGINQSIGANTVVILDGARWNCGTTTSNGVFLNGANQKLYLVGGTHVGGTTAAVNRTAGLVYTDPTTVFDAGAITSLAPASCAESAGNGTCALVAGSTNEKGTVRITAGTTTLLNPSFSMNWAGTYVGPSAAAPSCTFIIKNTGTGSWITAAPTGIGLPFASAISTTAVTVNILTTVNTVATSTYDVGYVCTAT